MSTFGLLTELVLGGWPIGIVFRAFRGADGVVAGLGLCEASVQQAYLKESIVARAAEVIVLADSAKLGRARQQHWTPLTRKWCLITSALADDAALAPFAGGKR
jgi:DeoR/GlpR family transcriptional regulator of sugar metabolism